MRSEKLGTLFTIASGGTPNRSKPEYFADGQIPWVKTGDLGGKYIAEPLEKISQIGFDNSSTKVFPPKTVLVAMYGATIGSCSILDFEAATNQACAAFLPNEEVHHEYLYYFLRSIKRKLIALGQGGGQPNISAAILKSILIPVPEDFEDQIRIAHLLDKVERLIAQRKQHLGQLDDLLKSVFLEMFGDAVRNERGWEVHPLEELVADDCPLTYGIVQPGDEFPGGVPVVRPVDLTGDYVYLKGLKSINPIIASQFQRTKLLGGELLMCVRGTTGVLSIASEELSGANVTRGITPISR